MIRQGVVHRVLVAMVGGQMEKIIVVVVQAVENGIVGNGPFDKFQTVRDWQIVLFGGKQVVDDGNMFDRQF